MIDQQTLNLILNLMRRMPLFQYLQPDQLQAIAPAFRQVRRVSGDRLYREGDTPDSMYLFASGGGLVTYSTNDGQEQILAPIQAGDSVGEEALFVNNPRMNNVVINQDTMLFELSRDRFNAVLDRRPDIQPLLNIRRDLLDSLIEQRKHRIRNDERRLLVTRRHIFTVIGNAFISAVLFAVLMGAALLSTQTGIRLLPPVLIGAAVLLPSLLMLYYLLEWRNDYFVITDQRIVHEEYKLLTWQESHEQALLTRIQNVSVSKNGFFGELLEFGDVTVSTAGNQPPIVLDRIPNPNAVQQVIFDQLNHIKQQPNLRDPFANEIDAILTTPPPPPQRPTNAVGELSRAVLPPIREVNGETITYRKSYLRLLGHIWRPLIVLSVLFALVVARLLDLLPLPASIPPFVAVAVALAWLIIGTLWFLWGYVDWRDDLYMVDDRYVTAIKRRPLWLHESRIQAGLLQVQNVGSKVSGLWGQLFNVGTVTIQTAAEQGNMIFDHVHNPRAIAEEILRRVERAAQRENAARQQDQRRAIADYVQSMNAPQGQPNIGNPQYTQLPPPRY
jgi:CRP-like cAMP-binding protein